MFVIPVEPSLCWCVAKDFDSLCLILQHISQWIRPGHIIDGGTSYVHKGEVAAAVEMPDTHYLFRSPSLLHPLIRWTAFPCLLIAYIGQFWNSSFILHNFFTRGRQEFCSATLSALKLLFFVQCFII